MAKPCYLFVFLHPHSALSPLFSEINAPHLPSFLTPPSLNCERCASSPIDAALTTAFFPRPHITLPNQSLIQHIRSSPPPLLFYKTTTPRRTLHSSPIPSYPIREASLSLSPPPLRPSWFGRAAESWGEGRKDRREERGNGYEVPDCFFFISEMARMGSSRCTQLSCERCAVKGKGEGELMWGVEMVGGVTLWGFGWAC